MTSAEPDLVAPFPYFGGKRRVAAEVWARFGDVPNYVEPFFGSGAVLLARPNPAKVETVNDLDGLLCNFWRAVRAAPEEVAKHADWPVSESDLHPRHLRLVRAREDVTRKLQADPDWFDAKLAGWWVWGACAWIGAGWCSGEGTWEHDGDDWVKLGDRGRGINRKLPHLSDRGRGINRQLPNLGSRGQGIAEWFTELQQRLRDVRVACGSWERVLGTSILSFNGARPCGVFLDPPYDDGNMAYSVGGKCAADVRAWVIENGDNPKLRIALCGYDEHNELAGHGWTRHGWKAKGGYGKQSSGDARARENSARETVWFSPHCLPPSTHAWESASLFKEI